MKGSRGPRGPYKPRAYRTAKPGSLTLPPPAKRRGDYGSKRWFWPFSQTELNAWRAARAAINAGFNPEQLDLFRHALTAADAAEAGPAQPVPPKKPRRRPKR